MARSTFDGPVLVGDNRFGPFRNVGYASLTQSGYLNLVNTTVNTAGYSGVSGTFVNSNNIPNGNATVYVPSSTSPVLVPQVIPADTTSQIYRGWVFYVPTGCDMNNIFIDVAVVPTVASGSISTIRVYMSNNYTVEGGTPTYAAVTNITSVGRQTLATFTGTQITNQNNSTVDMVGINGDQQLSQIVFTLSINGSSMGTLNAGQIYFAIRYTTPDGNIGSATAYPFGNFD